jgi:hypothetical protein
MKSKAEIKASGVLETNANLQITKMSKNIDENTFVCAQNDKDCWYRYLSAMGDCV